VVRLTVAKDEKIDSILSKFGNDIKSTRPLSN